MRLKMIVRFIVFLSLWTLKLTHGNADKRAHVLTKTLHDTASFAVHEKLNVTECVLITNTGEKHSYLPGSRPTFDDVITYGREHACGLYISDVTERFAGYWSIIVKKNTSETIEYKFKLDFEMMKPLEPKREFINVFEGYRANIRFADEFENLTGCNVEDPHGRSYNMLDENINHKNIKLHGQCGISILGHHEYHGKWILRAIIRDSIIYHAQVTLTILKEKTEAVPEKIYLQRGITGKIFVGPESGVTFCHLIDPRGVLSPLLGSRCFYSLNEVTSLHDGQWKAIYGLPGRIDLIQMNFTVITYENPSLNASLTIKDDGEHTLICDHRVDSNPDWFFCRFIRPDNVILYLHHGIGRDSYESYSKTSNNKISCGIIIRKPSTHDYGAWRCEIGPTLRQGKYVGSVIQLNNPAWEKPPTIPVHVNNVIVKQGNSFKIKCVADAVLDYCYFSSPNGTVFTITENEEARSNSNLLYDGFGLSLGHCGAIVPSANDNTNGEWKCLMGVSNGSELEGRFTVTVTETNLIAKNDKVYVEYPEEARLSCELLPTIDNEEINYCRWVTPSGHGFYHSVNDRYETIANNTHCELIIKGANVQDVGRWKCVAGLIGKNTEVAWKHIDLNIQYPYMNLWFYIIIAFAVISLASLSYVMFMKIRQNQRSKLMQYISSQRNQMDEKIYPSYDSPSFVR